MPANSYHNSNSRCRAKDVFKHVDDHNKEPQMKPGTLPVGVPPPQAAVAADNASDLTTGEKDGNSMDDNDHLPLRRGASHVSACAAQSQDQACGQQSQDKRAPISMVVSEDVGNAGEYGYS